VNSLAVQFANTTASIKSVVLKFDEAKQKGSNAADFKEKAIIAAGISSCLAACPVACAIGGTSDPVCWACCGGCVTLVPGTAAISIAVIQSTWSATADKFTDTAKNFENLAKMSEELEKDAQDKGQRLAEFEGELKSCQDFVNKYKGIEQV